MTMTMTMGVLCRQFSPIAAIIIICTVICSGDNGLNANSVPINADEASLLFKLQPEEDEKPNEIIDTKKTLIWGPGLTPHEIVLPARYFFVHFVGLNGEKLNSSTSLNDELHIRIDCNGERQIWSQILNRKDGSFIVRYKVFQSCASGFRILVTYGNNGNNAHLGKSPYIIKGSVHPDNCNCPKSDVETWQKKIGCNHEKVPDQIQNDLRPFRPKSVDFEDVLSGVKERFGAHPGSYSFCHYSIIDNQVYRKCYGQYIGFHIFPDSILLSLTRKMYLPDIEFIMNMGDWPLSKPKKGEYLLPILSWCKSNETADIVLPTYELTEASLEGMGRVSLDMLTVQSNTEKLWKDKIPKLFWRGRDSRQERLDLIQLGRKYPDLFNVSLTNFFFFRDKEHIYGPKADHISFFKFFDYKYQLSIDGTVAAYRLPYLLAGDSVIFKTDSPYSEHFYSDLKPWTHYIPVAADLSDLVDKINWAQNNDAKAYEIGQRARAYAQNHLMPLNILCYHSTVYNEFAKRLKNPVIIRPDIELVKQPTVQDPRQATTCGCQPEPREPAEEKDEL